MVAHGGQLPLSQRDIEIMSWYYADGRSYEDIGRLLQITKQSVHERVVRACEMLTLHGVPLPKRADTPKLNRVTVDPQILDNLSNRVCGRDRDLHHGINDEAT